VAGPRGSGKSTLLRALTAAGGGESPRALLVSAPVLYDPVDFTRYLYLKLASKIDQSASPGRPPSAGEGGTRVLLQRLMIGLAIGAAGVLWLWHSHGRMSSVTVADVSAPALIVTSVTMIILALRRYRVLAGMTSAAGARRPSAALAACALERLSYDAEVGTKSSNSFSVLGKSIVLDDESSKTLRSRPLTHPEITAGMRELLKTFSYEDRTQPVVVAIDELDKLDSTDSLIRMVNGLKDLFHIEGVHFVVSVSTDALDSFARRGVPARDVFDSSFDLILGVGPLTLDESTALLKSRSTGFPEELSKFCHAWSGGLPRDLLRAARRCVELGQEISVWPTSASGDFCDRRGAGRS
jgi:energy-coupling factor transporter ATP-binding protein EcfA2